MPRVSVLVVSYNHKPYVAQAIDSVLAQTYDDFEVIVLDNGSTDGSRDLLRERFGENPKVRLVLNDENKSLTTRFNQGIALAQGEYIGFLYSDDLYLPMKLELQVAAFEKLDASFGVVTASALKFDDRTKEQWPVPPTRGHGMILGQLLREGGPSDMLSPLVRRACFARYPFYEDIFAETESAYQKLAMTYAFSWIPEPVVLLREHGSNRGRAVKSNVEMGLVFLDRLAQHPDFPKENMPDLVFARRSLLRTAGWSVVRLDGDSAWARKCFREAIELDWREAVNPRTVAGYALSYVPEKARAALNALGHRITQQEGTKNLVADYGGTEKR